MSIEQRIKEANGRLQANSYKLKIEKIGNKLILRGILPPKPNSGKYIYHQQRISIASANFEGVRLAEKKAKKISIQLDNKEFDWADYLDIESLVKPKTIGMWLEALEKDYFSRRAKNYKSETTWYKDYEIVFRNLDVDNKLTPEIIKQVILSTQPDSRTRKRYCLALGVLARFAGVEFDPSLYMGNYSPKRRKPRELPTDKQISECFLTIDNPKWRWVFGMLATYGLRNHEVFFLDLDDLRDGNKVLTVLDGKTGFRRVWPFHPEWIDQFDLTSVKMPQINLNRTNTAIGGTVSQHFRRNQQIPFKVYDLRHCWAIRTLEYGIDVSLAAQQMGHSLQVHSTLYHTWITSAVHQRAFDLALQKSDRPKPPQI
ncbi:integrase family protein [Tolypothrix tenuis PCC 7101]|uniref:Integrase family protein n=1 Tax=Tolypothrix tenuis PCC 7101 TaxID=231146 RepID=A0A1Z4N962_9CYAN|nr:site-specific integrase [Aulosira sp. FACHB-113]BAZ02266.1 integrase family protein [Tolypothrix tenuis PCC 7101]BAZ73813.1 integrase family protein [Aulosira laxa NIES-50]